MTLRLVRLKSQPFCRCCGKPIRKYSATVYVKHESDRAKFADATTRFSRTMFVDVFPRSKAECQKLTNLPVLSISRRDFGEGDHVGTVYSFTEWDGLTYVDADFCSGVCEDIFARLAVQAGFSTGVWRKAAS